jgi:hypothetical protein
LKRQERFWERVTVTESGCWLWDGYLTDEGYGRLGRALAHRLAWEWLRGPIPPELTIDHLCRVRRCVNPAHLEPVTMQENGRRGDGFAGRHARQTTCVNGHPFTLENTYNYTQGRWHHGRRMCRACDAARKRRQRASAA